MKRVLRWIGYCLLGLVGIVAVCAALLGYYVYVPAPAAPQLSGTLSLGEMTVGGRTRTFLRYVPRGMRPGAPLVLVMHGSGEQADQIRVGTGYGFERLADKEGFAVVYPNSISFDWNDCSRVGDFSVDGREADDVGYLNALVERTVADLNVDPRRVFATGVSAGGFMSLRLAIEAPERYRAVAAVSASVPAPENFKCHPAGVGTSVMIMNGTKDPLVPFKGGEVNLLGLFYKNGNVRSARDSAQYFADLNEMGVAPTVKTSLAAAGIKVEQARWRRDPQVEVELVTVHGGGHGLPQPTTRRPRLLGPSPMDPDGPAMIWAFFARQAAR
jgi:polyhydroxybutyrate depolymerase